MIIVRIHDQTLLWRSACGQQSRVWPISSGQLGVGQEEGSFKTPLGEHCIRAKIGQGVPINGVFKARRWTGEVCTADLYAEKSDVDWILTRILWLTGVELGYNRGGCVDTMKRFIYIHGCPDACVMGKPFSRGCIRMWSNDVMSLFNLVVVGEPVSIVLE